MLPELSNDIINREHFKVTNCVWTMVRGMARNRQSPLGCVGSMCGVPLADGYVLQVLESARLT